jgi:hypothetical protein
VLEPGVLRPTTTALRLADMDRDGVDATVMYGPIVPLLIKDPELRQVRILCDNAKQLYGL